MVQQRPPMVIMLMSKTPDLMISPKQRQEIRGWALLALTALALAGLLALLLVLSRVPAVSDWLPWGNSFFYRALITHVVLSVDIWFLACLGLLSAMVAGGRRGAVLGWVGLALSFLGMVLLLSPALADQGEPSLNNYVPVLNHPLFSIGLLFFALGIALACLRLWPFLRPSSAPFAFGVACAGAIYLMACLCFAMAYVLIPSATDSAMANERLFWGGGHVLQLLNTMLLLLIWQDLAQRLWGPTSLPVDLVRAAYLLLLAFALGAPLLYLRFDVLSLAHRHAFTALLWYGLPLPCLAMGFGVARCLWQARPLDWRSPAILSLFLSLAVFAIGGLAGFFLGIADTRTPSHYHAVIGGVNLGLMGLFLVRILPVLGRPMQKARLMTRAFHLYGWGQLLHALGFFLAGAAGVPRKTAGLAQGLDSLWKEVAMGVVGLGGAIAVLGGVLFVWLILARLLSRTA